jgi:hypothetical protein
MTVISQAWYETVEGATLEQGDVLFACPIVVPPPNLTFPLSSATSPAELQLTDVVVMTQSCDLVNDKLEDIILCPHWDLKEAGKMDPALGKKDTWKLILKGQRYQYAMLEQWQGQGISMGIRIVDFGRIFSLPRNFVMQFAASKGKRLRLCSPYREHLSQSFARFFMRVGLPQDIRLPE